jgi:hypothetical protein
MPEAPRSNRPTPRTPAATEAELRRRIRAELEEARNQADGQLDDAALAGVIARAISAALEWHHESPEHTRNATLSSRTWRPAGGPRGGRGPRDESEGDDRPPRRPRDFDRPPRDYDRPPRDFDRPPRDYDRPPRDYDRPPRDYDRPPRDYDRPPRDYDRPRRDYDADLDQPPREYDRGGSNYDRGPRSGGRKYDRPPRSGGRPPTRGGGFKRGGFKPRRPR